MHCSFSKFDDYVNILSRLSGPARRGGRSGRLREREREEKEKHAPFLYLECFPLAAQRFPCPASEPSGSHDGLVRAALPSWTARIQTPETLPARRHVPRPQHYLCLKTVASEG